MSRIPNLNGFLYFETVARCGTISRASEEMGVSASAISQQIKLLEQQLGTKLFRREGRSLSLTQEGEQLFQTANTALRMLRDAHRHFGQSQDSYQLNMRVTPSFGARWLGPRLSDFVTRHPNWDLRIDAAPDPTDFDREMVELELRYGTGNWPGYHNEPIFEDRVLPMCSPAYLAALGPGDPADLLARARLIGTPRAMVQWGTWAQASDLPHQPAEPLILMDRSTMALQLAVDGVGVVLDSMALAMQELTAGQLVPMLPAVPVLKYTAYWAICPPRYLKRRAVQEFLDWITDQATRFESEVGDLYARHAMREVAFTLPQVSRSPSR